MHDDLGFMAKRQTRGIPLGLGTSPAFQRPAPHGTERVGSIGGDADAAGPDQLNVELGGRPLPLARHIASTRGRLPPPIVARALLRRVEPGPYTFERGGLIDTPEIQHVGRPRAGAWQEVLTHRHLQGRGKRCSPATMSRVAARGARPRR